MAKVKNIVKKTHAYILDDGTVVRAISAAHVDEYQKDKVQVYSANATKTVEGIKTEATNYYVATDDFVKKTTARQSLSSKLAAAIIDRDLSSMTASELVALLA